MKAGWKTVKLGEACKIVNGATPSTSVEANWGGPHCWITPAEMGGLSDPYVSKTRRTLTDAGLADCSASLLPTGSVILSSRAPIGHVIINTVPMATNQGCKSMIPRSDLDAKFLFYFIKANVLLLESLGTGATFKELSGGKLASVEIPLPPLVEQKQIVALLDEAFAGIDKLSSNAKKRSSEALHVFEQERDSFFSNSENKYTETTISEVTTRLQYGTSEKSASTGRYVVLRMGNIQDGEIDYEDLKYTSSQEVIDQYCLKPGDVLFNRTNSPQWVGKSAIYRGEMPAVFAGYNIKIHTIADQIDSEFLTFFLNSDRAMSFGRSTFISSVNQANINAEKLRSYRLPLPPLLEQKKIAERLKQVKKMSRDLYTIYDNILTQSNHLKAAILSHAFNGAL
jgi:type I restriction enzyme S subunit